jgi:hypothetical protein
MRRFFLFSVFSLSPAMLFAATGDKSAQPASEPTPAPAIPAVLDVITFQIHDEDGSRKIVVTPAPGLLRVDTPDDGLSIIYHPATEFYIGLENRNYTYWEFSWPDVEAAVKGTTRYQTRLKDVGTQGLNGYLPDPDGSGLPSTNAPPPNPFAASDALMDTNSASAPPAAPPTPTVADQNVSGYVWKPEGEKKRIAGIDCVKWSGDSVSGSPVEAWCCMTPLPKVRDALARLREINEPIALVPVRSLVPAFVFEVVDDLAKGGVTPVDIAWGDDPDKNHFTLVSVKTREGRAKLFAVPSLYVKTTLVTMDGIGNQKPGGILKPQNEPNVPLPRPAGPHDNN